MAYANLEQAQALSKQVGRNVRIEVGPFPKISSKLAAIDPEGVSVYNQEVERWVSDLLNQIRRIGEDL